MNRRTATAASSLRVEEITTLDRFEALASPWDDLCRRALECYPMLMHAWLCAWWKAFSNDNLKCSVLLVWEGDVLAGAAPITVRHERAFGKTRRIVSLFANAWVDRAHILLARDSADIVDALLAHLESKVRFEILDLFPLDADSPQTALLLERVRRRGCKIGVDAHLQSPYLRLPDTWKQLLEGLSSSFRQTVRRKIRKVESMPEVTMRIVKDESCIGPIVTISRESWQHDEGTSMASTERILTFYTTIIKAAARDGTLRCALMEVGGEPAAFEFNLAHRNTLHNFKLGFRKRFSDLSTGIVLKSYALQQLMDGGPDSNITEYDFMGTSEPYKLNWSKSVRSHNRYYIFARQWHVLLAYRLAFQVKPWLQARAPGLAASLKSLKNRLAQR